MSRISERGPSDDDGDARDTQPLLCHPSSPDILIM